MAKFLMDTSRCEEDLESFAARGAQKEDASFSTSVRLQRSFIGNNDQNITQSPSLATESSDMFARVFTDKSPRHLQEGDEAYFLPLQLPTKAAKLRTINGLLLANRQCGSFTRLGVAHFRDEEAAEMFETLTEGDITIA